MALRQLAHAGTAWTVWAVCPTVSRLTAFTFATASGFEEGWLCFESAGEKRRLAPIPADWTEWPDARLVDCLISAPVVPARTARGSSPHAAPMPGG